MNNEVLSSHKSLTQELHFARRISGFCTRYLARGRFSLSHVRTLSERKWQRQMRLEFVTYGWVTKPHELRTVRISNNYNVFYVILYSALLGYYTASSGKSLPTFRDHLWVPSSWPTGCPETSVRKYHYSLDSNPEEHSYHLFRGGRLKLLNTGVQHVYVRFYTGLQHVYVSNWWIPTHALFHIQHCISLECWF